MPHHGHGFPAERASMPSILWLAPVTVDGALAFPRQWDDAMRLEARTHPHDRQAKRAAGNY